MQAILLTLRAAGLVLAVAAAGLWARSHHVRDQYTWPVRAAASDSSRGFEQIDSRTVQTAPGRLVFQERTALM